MSNLPPPPPPPPPGRGRGQQQRNKNEQSPGKDVNPDGTPAGKGPGSWPKWAIYVMVGVLAAAILVPTLWPSDSGESLEYSEWRELVVDGEIATAEINTGSGKITGEFNNEDKYSTSGGGERGVSEADEALLLAQDVKYKFIPPSSNWLLGPPLDLPAHCLDHWFLRLDAAPCTRPNGRRHVDRQVEGQGVRRQSPLDDV